MQDKTCLKAAYPLSYRRIQNSSSKIAMRTIGLMQTLTTSDKSTFEAAYHRWKEEWHETLCHSSHLKSGKTRYTHKRLRSAIRSVDFYPPYLFTFRSVPGMPNTNNKTGGNIHRPEEKPEQP